MKQSQLVFDVGNSTIKSSEVKEFELVNPSRTDVSTISNLEEFRECFGEKLSNASHVAVSVGVKRFSEYFLHMQKDYGFELVFVSGENNCGAKIDYLTPGTLGSDRVANTLAVVQMGLEPCIVVDCGTAINVDVINSSGVFIGGMITAGLQTTIKGLQHFAPALPDIELATPQSILGTDTFSCIQSGIVFGTVGMIESSVSRLRKIFEIENLVITGGHSEFLHPLIETNARLEPWLTLKGLASVKI